MLDSSTSVLISDINENSLTVTPLRKSRGITVRVSGQPTCAGWPMIADTARSVFPPLDVMVPMPTMGKIIAVPHNVRVK
jgi:hypothetical protein